MERKIFFVQQNASKEKKDSKITISEDGKTTSSANTGILKLAYCLRELVEMPESEMQGKIFTFIPELAQETTKHEVNSTAKNLELIIRNLPCMKGIDEEFVPTFKYFKINKSKITFTNRYSDSDENKVQERTMICFIDISQKILYETSKAESELHSLINSTISHEMRNPLNSIINNCKIGYIIGQQFASLLQIYKGKIDEMIYS